MGQKKPIETDLPEAEFEEFIAMADAEGLPPDDLFGAMIQEGLTQTRVQKTNAVVFAFEPHKKP